MQPTPKLLARSTSFRRAVMRDPIFSTFRSVRETVIDWLHSDSPHRSNNLANKGLFLFILTKRGGKLKSLSRHCFWSKLSTGKSFVCLKREISTIVNRQSFYLRDSLFSAFRPRRPAAHQRNAHRSLPFGPVQGTQAVRPQMHRASIVRGVLNDVYDAFDGVYFDFGRETARCVKARWTEGKSGLSMSFLLELPLRNAEFLEGRQAAMKCHRRALLT